MSKKVGNRVDEVGRISSAYRISVEVIRWNNLIFFNKSTSFLSELDPQDVYRSKFVVYWIFSIRKSTS